LNRPRSGLLQVAEAVFDAVRALRRAAATVDELRDLAASSLRVLDDAENDAFYAHQENQREFYMESATEHLGRLRNTSGVMNEIGADLIRHLDEARAAVERAAQGLESLGTGDQGPDVAALRSHVELLGQ
jgi:hypothetical protein